MGSKNVESPAGGSYSMWNFQDWIRKVVEFSVVANRKLHRVSKGYFLALGFPGSITLTELHWQRALIFPNFPRQTLKLQWNISKDVSPTSLLVLDSQIDPLFRMLRSLAYDTELKCLLESPPPSKNSKSIYFYELELLTPFLISWTRHIECYSTRLPTNSAACRLFSSTCIIIMLYYLLLLLSLLYICIIEVLMYSKKLLWCYAVFGYVVKMKLASSHCYYL